jgi:hypothetical protein
MAANIDVMSGGHEILGVDHVQLAAPPGSEGQARRFFGEILGMEELPKPEPLRSRGGVWFRCGTHQLHIGVEKDFAPNRKAHPAFAVQNLATLRERLHAAGIATVDDEALPGAQALLRQRPLWQPPGVSGTALKAGPTSA